MQYADFAFTTFRNMLAMTIHLIAKAEEAGKGADLLDARLAEDMFPLARQITIVGWQVNDMLNRCAGTQFAQAEDDPRTLAEGRDYLASVGARLEGIDAGACAAEDQTIGFDLPMGIGFELTAGQYVRDWAIPQFYFHVMTIYAILRSQGVDLGKRDYVPYMMQYLKPGSTLG
ncbi:hypothetical protein B2G71_13265 [Novosphingobium sp. PC22D]|uniref:DUF1993 domain-containing protein n=1 Tax=Novosphingobium sp. PC22D TaxID=1962403 RepID=UPI000BFAED89|nr:DUF1993 domain-containing protein [Novosphingobium sp. PC22D]PEQ12107.1 hypothetical protein B2G71_13265 [Novosphingobium sp. PC22D]